LNSGHSCGWFPWTRWLNHHHEQRKNHCSRELLRVDLARNNAAYHKSVKSNETKSRRYWGRLGRNDWRTANHLKVIFRRQTEESSKSHGLRRISNHKRRRWRSHYCRIRYLLEIPARRETLARHSSVYFSNNPCLELGVDVLSWVTWNVDGDTQRPW